MSAGRKRWFRRVVDLVSLALAVAAAIHLWPASLGGSTRLVVVQGTSMEPTFHLGDLMVVRENPHPHVGDIIVFHIPKGEPAASLLVVHRVIAIRDDGSYLTQGDNRKTADDFHIEAGDVVGSPVMGIPHAGRLIGLASTPLAVGLAAGLITCLLMWPPTPRRADDSADSHDDDPAPGETANWDQDPLTVGHGGSAHEG